MARGSQSLGIRPSCVFETVFTFSFRCARMQPGYAAQMNAASQAISNSYDRLASHGNSLQEEEDDEDDVVEQDREGKNKNFN